MVTLEVRVPIRVGENEIVRLAHDPGATVLGAGGTIVKSTVFESAIDDTESASESGLHNSNMCVTGDPTLVEPNDVPSDDDGVVSPLGIVMTPVLSLTTSWRD